MSQPTDTICITCGSTNEDEKTAFCENNHDDWLELRDEPKYFLRAAKNLNMTVEELYYKLETIKIRDY
jgi:hypothetical protein